MTLKGQCHTLGAGIFPFSSLINHSCWPNVTRIPTVNENNQLIQIILAQHPIKKGSQVYQVAIEKNFFQQNASYII